MSIKTAAAMAAIASFCIECSFATMRVTGSSASADDDGDELDADAGRPTESLPPFQLRLDALVQVLLIARGAAGPGVALVAGPVLRKFPPAFVAGLLVRQFRCRDRWTDAERD